MRMIWLTVFWAMLLLLLMSAVASNQRSRRELHQLPHREVPKHGD